jgi:U3 small nucleolar RNA-associated protein 7
LNSGIELDDDDVITSTALLTQDDLLEAVDINTQKKVFDLPLKQHAPYMVQYTQSGRYMLIGGHRGHIASLRWRDFEMKSEVRVNETVRAIQ